MKSVRIITVNGRVFGEEARAIEYSLKEMGVCESALIQDNSKVDFDKHFNLNFIFRAFRPFPSGKLKGIKIIRQVEELWNRREKGVYDMSQGYDRSLEMYDENLKIPRGTADVVYCPVGYSPVWESHLPEVEEDIDVLFYGSIIDRRLEFQDALNKMRLNVVFTDDTYGIERDKLIMRSKIVLNIKAHKKWSYGPMHCLPVQANKKFMLAEKADGGYGPFKPEVHFLEYDGIEHCKHAIDYWLKHEEERKQFSLNAYEDMVKTCDFTPILRKALGAHPEKNLPSLIIEPKVKVIKKLKKAKAKPKVEEPKVEEPKVEELKVEEPKIEEPKIEELKVEELKVEENIITPIKFKYENFNVEPGMTTWSDMPNDYKKEYFLRKK